MAEKATKREVDYSAGMGQRRCKNCEHFIKPRTCELVAGDINPQFWCRLFERAT